MIRRFLTLSLPIFLVLTLMFPTNSMAITAEDRLIEVERQLQAIAEQISNYEGQLTDLENAILENDKDLQQVNQELAEVQSRLSAAERELEKALENELIGTNGIQRFEVNAYGKRINQIDFEEGEKGKRIQLTIDTEVQKLTHEVLENRAGSISVMDIYTGEIIAMNSSPSFDPNLFLYGIDKEKWREIQI